MGVDAPDRFARLAFWYPELLTHEEQMRWKLIRECGYLWLSGPDEDGNVGWRVSERTLVFERLRETWDKFCAVASGTADSSTLPTWEKIIPRVQPSDDFP